MRAHFVGSPSLGLPRKALDRGSLLRKLAHRDIDSLTIKLGDEKTMLLNAPGYVRHVLTANSANYTKDTAANRFFRDNVADGILTADGERWSAQRALLSPTFRDVGRLTECTRTCVESTSAMLDRCASTGEAVNLAAVMAQLTLAIATETMFALPPEPFLELCVEAGALLDDANSMLPQASEQVTTVRRALLDALRGAIASIDNGPGPVARALLDDPGHQHGEAVTNQALSLLLAGFETTANSLTWAWILLMQHPEIYAKLQQSLTGGEGDPHSALTRAVIEESLRLYPSAWIIGRRAIHDDHVDGIEIPAGTAILISPYLIQRHPRWWYDADEFRPERFLPGGRRPSDRYAYIPFGAGSRACIGSAYALEEASIIVSVLARRFTFRPSGRIEDVVPELKFVLRAPDPLSVTVQRRDDNREGSPV